jgi:NADPH:quinone reductase-like Zn-dependent oxidoreductase
MTTEVVLPGIVAPEGLQIRTRELAAPGPGQVRVAVEATGVSFAEQQMLRGKYYDQPPFPFVPGYDLVGTVTAVGPDGDESMIEIRYAAVTKVGAWASDVVLDADDLVEVPDGVDPAAAATLLINGGHRLPHALPGRRGPPRTDHCCARRQRRRGQHPGAAGPPGRHPGHRHRLAAPP